MHGRGLVKVTLPDNVDLPTLKAGDEVSLVASVGPDGTFTLVSLDNEDASDSNNADGVDMGDSGFAVRGVLSSLSPTSVGVRVEGHPEPVRCSVPPESNLSGFAVGQAVEMSCKVTGGEFVLVKLHPQTAGLPGDHNGSLDLNGSITALSSTAVTVAVSAESTPSVSQDGHSVSCALQPGADLRGFAVGDAVEVQCEYSKALGKYVLTGLSSDNATLSYGDTGLAEWFDLTGVLQSIRSDGVGIQVDGHPAPVNCAMPAGTDLSGFALGDTVELQCNFHDGKFNLASLSSDSAELTLE